MPPRRPGPPRGETAREARTSAGDMLRAAMLGPDESRRATVDRLGGTRAVAGMLGKSARSVRRWASGQTRSFRGDANQRLATADVRDRMNRRGLSVDPTTGTPTAAMRIQTRGWVSIRGSSGSDTYEYERRVGNQGGAQGGHQLRGDTVTTMANSFASGDNEAALQAFERQMTGDWVGVPGASSREEAEAAYDPNPEGHVGFRQTEMHDVGIYTDSGGGTGPLFP